MPPIRLLEFIRTQGRITAIGTRPRQPPSIPEGDLHITAHPIPPRGRTPHPEITAIPHNPQADQRLWIERVLGLADSRINAVPMDIDPPFDAAALGLKEVGNLASWTVSSCKPGCGVEALRDEDTNSFWQYALLFYS